jgi:hypothetical protein
MNLFELKDRLVAIGETRFNALCSTWVRTEFLSGAAAPFNSRVLEVVRLIELDPSLHANFESALAHLPIQDSRSPIDRLREWEAGQRASLFRRELFGRKPLVPSPVLERWEYFLAAPSWQATLGLRLDELQHALTEYGHGRVADLLNVAKSGLAYDPCPTLYARAKDSHLQVASQVVWRPLPVGVDAKTLTREREVRHRLSVALEDLRRFLTKASFGRCFCVIGGAGSGKTYSVASLLADFREGPAGGTAESAEWPTASSRRGIVVQLQLPPRGQPLRGAIDSKLQTTMGQADVALATLDAALFTNSGRPPCKVIFAIDEVDRWIDDDRGDELIDLVEGTSSGHVIYWMFTLLETRYQTLQRLARSAAFDEMCFGVEALALLLPEVATEAHIEAIEGKGYSIGPWLYLDALNRARRVGLEIIGSPLPDATSSAAAEEWVSSYDAIPERQRDETFTQPQIAWIVREQIASTPHVVVVRLQQLEILRRFWRDRLGTLRWSPFVTQEQLLQSMDLIAGCFVHEQAVPTLQRLAEFARGTGVVIGSEPPGDLDRALLVLQQMGLMAIREDAAQRSGDPVHSIEFRMEALWQWRIAQRPAGRFDHREFGSRRIVRWIEKYIVPLPERWRDAIVCLLLLLLEESDNAKRDLPTLYEQATRIKRAEAAPWFAGPRAGVGIQRFLMSLPLHPEDAGDSHRLFAHLYFLAGADRAIPVEARLRVLSPHLARIQEAGLAKYFLYLVERHLGTVPDLSTLFQCLKHLHDAGVLDTCERIAGKACAVLFEVTRTNEGAARAVAQHATGTRTGTSRYTTKNSESSRTFRSWFYCLVSRRLVDRLHPAQAYVIMIGAGWPVREKLSPDPLFDLRREAGFALGRWHQYRLSDQDITEFSGWFTELAAADSWGETNFAAYVITHALRKQTERRMPGDQRLRAPIVSLARRPGTPNPRKEEFWQMVALNAPEALSTSG